jgi:transposase-like protein
MKKQPKQCAPEEKVAILRRHLLEKDPISKLCDEVGLQPTVFYRWQKEFFENGPLPSSCNPAFCPREQNPGLHPRETAQPAEGFLMQLRPDLCTGTELQQPHRFRL